MFTSRLRAALIVAALLPALPALADDADLALLPANAAVAAHVDVKALLATPVVTQVLGQVKSNPNVQKSLAELKNTYGLDPEKDLQALTFMVDGSKKGRPLIVLHTTTEYAKLKAGAQKSDPKAKTTQHGKHELFVGSGNEGMGMAKHGKRVLLGDVNLIKAALDGKGKAKGDLATRYAQVSGKGQLWFATVLPPEQSKQLAAQLPGAAGLKHLQGHVDLSKGLNIAVTGGGPSFEPAKVVKLANTQLAEARKQQAQNPMMAAMGLDALINGVKIEKKGKEALFALKLSQAEVQRIQGMINMMLAMQNMKAPAAPPPQKPTPAKKAK